LNFSVVLRSSWFIINFFSLKRKRMKVLIFTLICVVGQLGLVFGTFYSNSFGFTGSVQNFTIPFDVTSIKVTAVGGSGGSYGSLRGGKGGKVETTLTVMPGTIYFVYIGGAGSPPLVMDTRAPAGWNGG
jgi:hypothetical protein